MSALNLIASDRSTIQRPLLISPIVALETVSFSPPVSPVVSISMTAFPVSPGVKYTCRFWALISTFLSPLIRNGFSGPKSPSPDPGPLRGSEGSGEAGSTEAREPSSCHPRRLASPMDSSADRRDDRLASPGNPEPYGILRAVGRSSCPLRGGSARRRPPGRR